MNKRSATAGAHIKSLRLCSCTRLAAAWRRSSASEVSRAAWPLRHFVRRPSYFASGATLTVLRQRPYPCLADFSPRALVP